MPRAVKPKKPSPTLMSARNGLKKCAQFLKQIAHDPKWGDEASALYEKIQQEIKTKDAFIPKIAVDFDSNTVRCDFTADVMSFDERNFEPDEDNTFSDGTEPMDLQEVYYP